MGSQSRDNQGSRLGPRSWRTPLESLCPMAVMGGAPGVLGEGERESVRALNESHQYLMNYFPPKAGDADISLTVRVECKKAQPKEVMMPNNVGRGRGAGRGAYGFPAAYASYAGRGGYPGYPGFGYPFAGMNLNHIQGICIPLDQTSLLNSHMHALQQL
ncbi:unnamed protein product [Oppiella nova]|uniref:Uncharacterized protein n=1 Tax=Oppiella nova TaxID=334625 RepID=A0A7R9LKZ8_9ACAR|nr:unnamed protein product [Oppiella nova]CAG2164016.1 unnamed protein product [Oppiella nova]